MTNLLPFADEYAPVWTDPRTGVRKPMTAAAWRAAGFDVQTLPTADLYVVDLDSRRAALPAGEGPPATALRDPTEPDDPHTG